jgi:hypothetical protein
LYKEMHEKGHMYKPFKWERAKIFQNKNTFFQLKTNIIPTEKKNL